MASDLTKDEEEQRSQQKKDAYSKLINALGGDEDVDVAIERLSPETEGIATTH